MHQATVRNAAVAATFLLPMVAQSGNEVLFVGSSTSGSADQHAFVESATGNVPVAAGTGFTDNVTDAVWTHQGRRLYVGQSLMNQVAVAEWDGATAVWSSFYATAGACYGVEFDRGRNLIWTLTGTSASTRELHCVNADISSPLYGSAVAQTTSLSGMTRERWCLSYSGNLACVPEALIGSNPFTLIDLDPNSPNYLNVIASTTMPGTIGAGFAFTADCKISIDDAYVYVLWSGLNSSGLAVWDVAAQAWLDFDQAPNHQDLMLPLGVPNRMDLALDRSFAVISGQGGSGWAARVDFDYGTPSNSTFNQYAGLTVPNCDGISLSPDSLRVAVTSTAQFLQTPSQLTVFDASSGTVLQTTNLASMWNVYTTAWQDASPVADYLAFGQGCAGTLGTPAIAAAGGTRPALGTTLQVNVSNLPFGVAAMATGLSNTSTTGGLPLPFDLGIIGMAGCTQHVDALVFDLVSDVGSSATWSWSVPNNPLLFGYKFFNQAFALDPTANTFGFTASHAAAGTIGY